MNGEPHTKGGDSSKLSPSPDTLPPTQADTQLTLFLAAYYIHWPHLRRFSQSQLSGSNLLPCTLSVPSVWDADPVIYYCALLALELPKPILNWPYFLLLLLFPDSLSISSRAKPSPTALHRPELTHTNPYLSSIYPLTIKPLHSSFFKPLPHKVQHKFVWCVLPFAALWGVLAEHC